MSYLLMWSVLLLARVDGTIDINLAEFQYLADHLTEDECHKLIAALHFEQFQIPKELNAAERRLPKDIPCIELLLHWNSATGEGKGKTHLELSHRLIQIGREDLASWLSKTVFHEISKDIKFDIDATQTDETTIAFNTSEQYPVEEIVDEAPWSKMDTILLHILVFGFGAFVVGSCYLCYLIIFKKPRKPHKGYKKVSNYDSD